ncbi:MAG: Crp/Fnr family transcriptional regulator [Marinilabiliaceae bacterium]|nr:Crp/Fnr family transcriptional regulator [Marinilabiliaceae bacterium]
MKEKARHDFKNIISGKIHVNDAEWELLDTFFDVIETQSGQVIQMPGKQAGYYFFVLEGALRMYAQNDEKEVTHNVYNHRRFVADVISIRYKQPSSFFIEALVPGLIICFDAHRLDKLLTISPTFEKIALMMYEQSLFEEMLRVNEILTLSPFNQYLHFVNIHKNIVPQLSQTKIAACLNVTPETISRFRKRMSL